MAEVTEIERKHDFQDKELSKRVEEYNSANKELEEGNSNFKDDLAKYCMEKEMHDNEIGRL